MHHDSPSGSGVWKRLGLNEFTFGLLGAAILLCGAVLWSSNGLSVEKTDFSLTYVGAKIVHDGLGHRLYDIELQKQVRDSLFSHPNPLFFEHPPFEAAFFSPLAAFPFRTAYMLWGLFNTAVWLALILTMRDYLPAPKEDLGYLSLWLLFAPLGVALFQGQSSLALLAIYSASFILLRNRHEFAAGFVLALGLFKFQFIIPFALIFLFRKRWRFVIGAACCGLVLGMISMATVGWNGILRYVTFVRDIGANPQNLSYGSAVDMPTIYGFVYAMIGHKLSPTGLNVVVLLASLAMLLWIGLRWHKEKEENQLLFAAAIAGSLLSSAHMFTHDFSPLALAMFLAAANLRAMPTIFRAVILSTLTVLWLPPLYFILVKIHGLYLMCPILLLFALPAVMGVRYRQCLEPNEARATQDY